MDTHRIGEPMGGRGGGIVVVFDKGDKHRNVCERICKRLRWSKVDTESPLSLALLKKETESESDREGKASPVKKTRVDLTTISDRDESDREVIAIEKVHQARSRRHA
ncbi:uncharacterized protein LOC114575250 [Exaiptasia diaphana]|uniref:Uncharacterized protein n=1 Tax=Exaiptasia diaphana TaxID=2652724 RepID=A0A913YKD2_EXADI|nr:uncharacterized protein LOC114575250 [Exaiptasia diaphana]